MTEDDLLKGRRATATVAIRCRRVLGRDEEDIPALDVALKRNQRACLKTLPPQISDRRVHKSYHGHFRCHVLHQDHIVKTRVDSAALYAEVFSLRGQHWAAHLSETHVGPVRTAKADLARFYKSVGPTGWLAPGIGRISRVECSE